MAIGGPLTNGRIRRTRAPRTTRRGERLSCLLAVATAALAVATLCSPPPAAAIDTTAPSVTTKIVFAHHSTGQAWLQTGYGSLGTTLGANNYYVSDTNYGWGPDDIGSSTDIGDWWTWFRDPARSGAILAALAANDEINSSYTRTLTDPGGSNTIVMFKSCFPNSAVGGAPGDAVPAIADNPLAGHGMNGLTVGNAKGVYLDLLEYFKDHPENLYVLVVSPPLRAADTTSTQAANARALANWLISPSGLLKDYTTDNVFVFDYYTVLTGGHHRVVNGVVEHSPALTNYLAYPTSDSHPSAAGDVRATAEFVPLLNAAYHAWQAGDSPTITASLTRRRATLSTPTVGGATLSRLKYYSWRGKISSPQKWTGSVTLQVQRRSGSTWVAYKTLTATLPAGTTAWTKKVRISKAGSYRVRAKHSDIDHFPASSAYRSFRTR